MRLYLKVTIFWEIATISLQGSEMLFAEVENVLVLEGDVKLEGLSPIKLTCGTH